MLTSDLIGLLFFLYFVIGTIYVFAYDKIVKNQYGLTNLQYLGMLICWPVSLIDIIIKKIFKKK